MTLVTVYDATHDNIGHMPPGQHAGYTTGTPDIRWTAEDWAAHPVAVRIDQDPAASDKTADVLDVERGAATVADVVPWVQAAHANRAKGARPGQRWPAIYASQAALTPIANALKAAGITGVFFWVADWNLDAQQAGAEVAAAGGPWPVVGVQYRNAGLYDVSLFSSAWLTDVTPHPAPVPAPAPAPAPVTVAQAEAALATLLAYIGQHKG